MSECRDAMANRQRLSILMGLLAVFEGLPGMLLPGQVILFSVLFPHPVVMRGLVV